MEDNTLEGLQYDELALHHNVHKLVGKLTKSQGGVNADIEVEEGATWLVTGLGYLQENTPEQMLAESLKDTIIISKSALIEFIKNK
jgi:hypothetical protein